MLGAKFISANRVIQEFPDLPSKLHYSYFTYMKSKVMKGVIPVVPEELYECMHYGLVKVAIENFGSRELQTDMNRFVQDMLKLRSNITVEEYIEGSSPIRDPLPTGHDAVEVTIDRDVTVCTMADVDNIRKDFIEEFMPKMSEMLVYLHNIRHGSVILEWGMPEKKAQEMNEVILQVSNFFYGETHYL
jgi:hypothetical protein